MKRIQAFLFKILFLLPFFRNRYFGFYKHLFKPRNMFKGQTLICNFDKGLKIKADLDEWIQQQIYFLGTWDRRGLNFLRNYLKKDDVFIDVGANIGAYSLVASKIVGKGGRIHSFEPVTKVFERFGENIRLNNMTNITANQKAVYNTSDIISIFVSSVENAGMSSVFHHDSESGIIEKVQAITIDDYVDKMNLQRVNMIKIDIEGAELFALQGMQNTLKKFRPITIIEISEDVLKNSNQSGLEVSDFMKSMGYEQKRIFKCGHTGNMEGSVSEYKNFAFFPV